MQMYYLFSSSLVYSTNTSKYVIGTPSVEMI